MINRDGNMLILPDNERVNLHLLFQVGITDNMQIGVHCLSEDLWQRLRNLPPADKQALFDHIILAVQRSLDKRMPRVINIS